MRYYEIIYKEPLLEKFYGEFQQGKNTVRIFDITGRSEFKMLLENCKELRLLLFPDRLFAWDANIAIHFQVELFLKNNGENVNGCKSLICYKDFDKICIDTKIDNRRLQDIKSNIFLNKLFKNMKIIIDGGSFIFGNKKLYQKAPFKIWIIELIQIK